MGQVTEFSGPERRRRWSDDERLQIVAEAFAPGGRVAGHAQEQAVTVVVTPFGQRATQCRRAKLAHDS